MHPSTPRWWVELPPPRTSDSSRPLESSSARSVLALPPSTASTSRRCATVRCARGHRPASRVGDGRSARAAGRAGCRPARIRGPADVSSAPGVHDRGRRWPLPTRPAARRRRRAGPGRAARARAAAGAVAPRRQRPIRAGTSTTSSSASPASVPSLRTSTTWTSPVSAVSEATQLDRGFAVEGAAALLEQGRLLRQRGVAVELEQPPLDVGHDLGARRAHPLLLDAPSRSA